MRESFAALTSLPAEPRLPKSALRGALGISRPLSGVRGSGAWNHLPRSAVPGEGIDWHVQLMQLRFYSVLFFVTRLRPE